MLFMFDVNIVLDVLRQILEASERVVTRFKPIANVDDFTNTPEGMEKLDSICMPIIAIGEGLKNIDKITNGELLSKYPQVDWKGAKGMRDIISHQYFDINAEAIYDVCDTKIKPLSDTIKKIIVDLEKDAK